MGRYSFIKDYHKLSHQEIYDIAFHKLLMRMEDGKLIGNSQRELFIPEINKQLEQPKSILDIGSGAGELITLSNLGQLDSDISAIEPQESFEPLYKDAVKKSQLNLKQYLKGSFQDSYSKIQDKFDLILGIHMIYHIDDVEDFINKCKSLLNPGGKLIFVYAKQEISLTVGAANHFYDSGTLRDIWNMRTKLIEQQMDSKVLESYLFAENEQELALMCMTGELGNEIDSLDKRLESALEFIQTQSEKIHLKKVSSGLRQGLLQAYQPQVFSVYTA
jgi:2-polyprenyl-3-methyl-5-hydroxy-6-metoxy-1,4-benzoquinol methylase